MKADKIPVPLPYYASFQCLNRPNASHFRRGTFSLDNTVYLIFQVNINTCDPKLYERNLHIFEKENDGHSHSPFDPLDRIPDGSSGGGGSRLSFPYIDGDIN